MLNNFVEKEKTFQTIKKNLFQSPKNRIFPKGLGDALGQKCVFFLCFVFGQNNSRNKV